MSRHEEKIIASLTVHRTPSGLTLFLFFTADEGMYMKYAFIPRSRSACHGFFKWTGKGLLHRSIGDAIPVSDRMKVVLQMAAFPLTLEENER